MKRIIVALVAALATILSGRGEIIYVNGPAFQIGSQGVDFDGDGAIECLFSSGGMICTAHSPKSPLLAFLCRQRRSQSTDCSRKRCFRAAVGHWDCLRSALRRQLERPQFWRESGDRKS